MSFGSLLLLLYIKSTYISTWRSKIRKYLATSTEPKVANVRDIPKGFKVRKLFEDGNYYEGEVISGPSQAFDEDKGEMVFCWRIKYLDDDEEEMTSEDLDKWGVSSDQIDEKGKSIPSSPHVKGTESVKAVKKENQTSEKTLSPAMVESAHDNRCVIESEGKADSAVTESSRDMSTKTNSNKTNGDLPAHDNRCVVESTGKADSVDESCRDMPTKANSNETNDDSPIDVTLPNSRPSFEKSRQPPSPRLAVRAVGRTWRSELVPSTTNIAIGNKVQALELADPMEKGNSASSGIALDSSPLIVKSCNAYSEGSKATRSGRSKRNISSLENVSTKEEKPRDNSSRRRSSRVRTDPEQPIVKIEHALPPHDNSSRRRSTRGRTDPKNPIVKTEYADPPRGGRRKSTRKSL